MKIKIVCVPMHEWVGCVFSAPLKTVNHRHLNFGTGYISHSDVFHLDGDCLGVKVNMSYDDWRQIHENHKDYAGLSLYDLTIKLFGCN